MNWKRWLFVGYLLALMAFTTSVLLIPGERYRTLTTSDSGFFYGLAREIEAGDGFVERYSLSHAPYGLPVGVPDQGHPLLALMLYRAVDSIHPGIELMDVARYWGLLLFALTLIPIFLIGRELGGDIGGCASAFFWATLTSTIYWHKVGAFDREPTQMMFGAWTIYLTLKLFKGPKSSMPKFALLAGLVFGLFYLVWTGSLFIAPIIIGCILLVVLSERLRWLPLLLLAGTGLVIWAEGKMVHLAYVLVGAFALSVLVDVLFARVSIESILRDIFIKIRLNATLICSTLALLTVMTSVIWVLGGIEPRFWVGFVESLAAYVGIGRGAGGGAVTAARYATEMQAPASWGDVIGRYLPGGDRTLGFYRGPGDVEILVKVAVFLGALAMLKLCWSKKSWELVPLPWFLTIAGLVWPGAGQARFDRLWWPFISVMAGVGVATLVSLFNRLSYEPSARGIEHLRNPIIIASLICVITVPFITNAYAEAKLTTAPPEWTAKGLDEDFLEAFDWLKNNTPEDSIVAIQWSFGHLLTGVAERPTVCDGCEVFGEEGVWENTAEIRPPDYIYYMTAKGGFTYGLDREAPPRKYRVNGRRVDVQLFPSMDENELRWLIRTYREDYGCRIDYVVFDVSGYFLAERKRREESADLLLDPAGIKARLQLPPTVKDPEIVFNFGGNREDVTFNRQTRDVYLKTGEKLDGYAIFTVTGGRLSDFVGFFTPPSPPDLPETLVIFFDKEKFPQLEGIVGAWLVKSKSAEIAALPTPIGIRVFTPGGIADIDYLEEAYTTRKGLVKVIKINHQTLL